MKWFFGVLLTLTAIAGAVFGVGYFLLDSRFEVVRETTVQRPRATIYWMAADLDRFNEWSPWRARHPNRTYTFLGPGDGQGQIMAWSPGGGGDRAGEQEIIAVTANQQVDYRLSFKGDGDYAMSLEILGRAPVAEPSAPAPTPAAAAPTGAEPTAAGTGSSLEPGAGTGTAAARLAAPPPAAEPTLVRLRATADCGPDPLNVPCRYMNLIRRARFERDFDDGLRRLTERVEALPATDFETLRPSFLNVQQRKFFFVNAAAPRRPAEAADQPPRVIAGAAEAVQRYMDERGVARARDGALTVVTTAANEARLEFQVGYPFEGPSPQSTFAVQEGKTPDGWAMRVNYRGPRTNLPFVYDQARAYLQARGLRLRGTGLPWEVYTIPGDPGDAASAIDVDVYFPIGSDAVAAPGQ